MWFTDDIPVDLLIFVGTVDKEVLTDKVHEGTLKEAGHGKGIQAYTKALFRTYRC